MLQEVLKHIPGELAAQELHVRRMDKVLRARRGLWQNERSVMVKAYIQHCILPRVTYSPADAAFCAVFMQRLIDFQTPWFPAFIYLDAVSALYLLLIDCQWHCSIVLGDCISGQSFFMIPSHKCLKQDWHSINISCLSPPFDSHQREDAEFSDAPSSSTKANACR